ncbi:hypothetical protein Bccel_4038 [Pseudobacteroides cellulosolvens ATCC 35603 = DSM 2933]|uniref:ATP phosphoribosyltransferase n=1 Tax=Pseudobacteroides cellulosolvens ATCC 35603 = DSM 2933 TaxID=398512 RepID=A0A0L6JSU8_9FIRM|nr:hypothetical protein Bccel_4038 [Pseudobacteroides cellulosolvens ATCC 35603 = DSM 2933]
MRYLTIALSKGRLTELSIELFEKIGIDCSELKGSSRKLILCDEKNKIKFSLQNQVMFLHMLNTEQQI